MKDVCMDSQWFMCFWLAVIVAMCPYSRIGLMKILKRRTIVEFDGPYFEWWRDWRRSVRDLAMDLMVVMWLVNDSFWSMVSPRNLPCDFMGIGVL